MIPFLAEAAPDTIKPWLEVLAWLVGLVGGIIFIVNQVKPQRIEQPLEVKAHNTPATQGDVDQLHGRIKRERLEIDAKLAELRAEDLRLRERLDNEIKELNERVTDVPQRTIALLKETKDLI